MKKALIAGVASAAFAVLPFAGAMAADPANVVDTLKVTIDDSCTFTRSTTTGVEGSGDDAGKTIFAKTMSMNAADQNFGSTTLKTQCNYAKGLKVTGTFSNLVNGSVSSVNIPYGAAAVSAGTAGWTAVKGDNTSTSYITSGTAGNVISTTAADGASGTTQQITYKVATSATQAAGTYTGTATYALTKNS